MKKKLKVRNIKFNDQNNLMSTVLNIVFGETSSQSKDGNKLFISDVTTQWK